MEKMWAPWRSTYLQECEPAPGCIFCTKPQQDCDRDNLIVYRGRHSFIICNRYPYNNGHLMLVPYHHTNVMGDLDAGTIAEIWRCADCAVSILTRQFRAQGFNIGMNLGRTAGAGIDQHLHLHLVPRWNGDTNFMPVVGEVKVISQGLWDAYDALFPLFQECLSNGSSSPPGT